jgi:hypothetical protein
LEQFFLFPFSTIKAKPYFTQIQKYLLLAPAIFKFEIKIFRAVVKPEMQRVFSPEHQHSGAYFFM